MGSATGTRTAHTGPLADIQHYNRALVPLQAVAPLTRGTARALVLWASASAVAALALSTRARPVLASFSSSRLSLQGAVTAGRCPVSRLSARV